MKDKETAPRNVLYRGISINLMEWVEGTPVYHSNGSIAMLTLIDRSMGFDAYIHPSTLGQFTTKYDCEGNKIYEGDIITDGKLTLEVVFNRVTAGFTAISVEAKTPEDFNEITLEKVSKSFKVIGSVHDKMLADN